MKLKTFRMGGIHPEENKLTADLRSKYAMLPRTAVFPLSQHIGAPAIPVVKRGDKVKVGTLLAEAGGFVSARIHSSVSGTILQLTNAVDGSGYLRPAITVRVEDDEWEEGINRSDGLERARNHPELTPENIVQKIKEAGVVGMGGACFPTHVKLVPPPGEKAECIIINAAECEPYITADHRLMIEHAEEILEGVELLMMAAKVDKAYIAIEENKPDAVMLLEQKAAKKQNIEVVTLRKKYPQGGEKQLVDAVLGRQIPAPPAIPVTVGAIVQNVGTAFAVYEAVMKNKPLIERYTTISGLNLQEPHNYITRIGTPVGDLIQECGGMPLGVNKILAGGPMMGKALVSDEVPVCKGTNAITILTGEKAYRRQSRPCIRCAKCVAACPMGLEPYLLATVSANHLWEKAETEQIVSCIECGCCQYTCPSNRPMLDNIRMGKQKVMGIIRERNKQNQGK